MEFKALEKLILDIANQKGIAKKAITEDLADFLRSKYSVSIMEKERDLIDEVKNKVITKLYNADNNSVSSSDDLKRAFKLDLLEIDYLDTAIDELIQEDALKSSKAAYVLTKVGVMKFKEFYGEI
jgi:hypothetical protein